MIENCKYKIIEWEDTRNGRNPKPKCKQIKGFVKECVGEENCEYVKRQNEIMKEQEVKK